MSYDKYESRLAKGLATARLPAYLLERVRAKTPLSPPAQEGTRGKKSVPAAYEKRGHAIRRLRGKGALTGAPKRRNRQGMIMYRWFYWTGLAMFVVWTAFSAYSAFKGI